MALPAETPFTVQPVEARTFPDLWVYGINILAPTTTSGRAEITTLPYSAERGEIYPGGHSKITTDELWLAIEGRPASEGQSEVPSCPEAAIAMGAILAAIAPLKAWIEARKVQIEADRIAALTPPAPPAPEPLPEPSPGDAPTPEQPPVIP